LPVEKVFLKRSALFGLDFRIEKQKVMLSGHD